MSKVKYSILLLFFFWVSHLIYLAIVRGGCSFSEEYALEHVLETVKVFKLDAKYLSKPLFNKDSCSYDFEYKSPDKEIYFIFTSWGDVKLWDSDKD
jgi:hypothetical protein